VPGSRATSQRLPGELDQRIAHPLTVAAPVPAGRSAPGGASRAACTVITDDGAEVAAAVHPTVGADDQGKHPPHARRLVERSVGVDARHPAAYGRGGVLGAQHARRLRRDGVGRGQVDAARRGDGRRGRCHGRAHHPPCAGVTSPAAYAAESSGSWVGEHVDTPTCRAGRCPSTLTGSAARHRHAGQPPPEAVCLLLRQERRALEGRSERRPAMAGPGDASRPHVFLEAADGTRGRVVLEPADVSHRRGLGSRTDATQGRRPAQPPSPVTRFSSPVSSSRSTGRSVSFAATWWKPALTCSTGTPMSLDQPSR
jgi:hypothetical protein